MNQKHIQKIANELNLSPWQIESTATVLEDGGTVPFIARYRKEMTGSLDEVAIAAIRDRLAQLADLDKRREAILKSLEDQGKLTDELKGKILEAQTVAVLEDIYLPYRPKRRTRATVARERGLEPLAHRLFNQEAFDPVVAAEPFLDAEKGLETIEDVLSGARDIIAEWVNEDEQTRSRMRALFAEKATFVSQVVHGKENEGLKYKSYFDWKEPAKTAPSHRILAMRRGEKEGFLTLRLLPPEDDALALLESQFVKGESPASDQVRSAVHDGYKRLLSHAMETEMRIETKKRANSHAIRVFANNLRQLLMAPPLGQKTVLALDPGFRTGCKLVCLNPQGKLMHTDTIFPFQSKTAKSKAGETIRELCERFHVEAVAIGNGTGGRELNAFIEGLNLLGAIQVIMVNESGASVYSASEAAREEFPDQDVTVRGAVSIGRRLMDPLAELIKVDPKSIGVGQYQHDVDQKGLKASLDDVVMSCVNAVGVEVNTASRQLLTYVSGLGPQLAGSIVAHREAHGPFPARAALKAVPRLGPKAFEQAAGFLRIRDGRDPLDASAVHPESYPIVEAMARDLKCSVRNLMTDEGMRKRIRKEDYITEKVGLPTLNDILEELAKPGRDPRERFESFAFAEDVEKVEDLVPGMKLPGVVTNITAFGAFVDVGVHQDGLVHVSRLADRFVKDPNEVVKLNQKVWVTVLDVDQERKRISLSMRNGTETSDRDEPGPPKTAHRRRVAHGQKKKEKPPFNNPFTDALKRR